MDTVIKWPDLSNFKSSTELSGHFKRCILGTCKVGLPSRFYYSNSTDQRVVFMNLAVNLRYQSVNSLDSTGRRRPSREVVSYQGVIFLSTTPLIGSLIGQTRYYRESNAACTTPRISQRAENGSQLWIRWARTLRPNSIFFLKLCDFCFFTRFYNLVVSASLPRWLNIQKWGGIQPMLTYFSIELV